MPTHNAPPDGAAGSAASAEARLDASEAERRRCPKHQCFMSGDECPLCVDESLDVPLRPSCETCGAVLEDSGRCARCNAGEGHAIALTNNDISAALLTGPISNGSAREQAKAKLKHEGTPPGVSVGGPTPKEIRAAARKVFNDHIGILRRIVLSKKSSNSDRIKAMNLLGKYGVGELSSVIDDEGNAVNAKQLIIVQREE